MSAKVPAPKRPAAQEVEAKRDILDFVQEHRKGLVAVGAILALVVVGVILFFTFRSRERDKSWASLHTTLEVSSPESRLRDQMRMIQELYPSERFSTQVNDPIPGLEELNETAGSDLQPFVLFHMASVKAENGDYEAALEAISALEGEYQDHQVNALPSPDSRYSLVGQLKLWCKNEMAWEASHKVEEVEVDTTTTALFETDKGAFWVGFYPEHAPEHVAHFIARAKAGKLNGVSVISIDSSALRIGGEASKDDDPKDDNDEPKGLDPLQPEPGRYKIPQTRGALSSPKITGGESPTMLDIVIKDRPLELDKRQTVFGQVLADRHTGLFALDNIKNLTTYATSTDEKYKDNPEYYSLQNHPVETIRIHRVSIWTGGKIADGHVWDTTKVVEPGTEPPPPAVEPETPKDEGTDEPDTPKDEGTDEPDTPKDEGSEKEEEKPENENK